MRSVARAFLESRYASCVTPLLLIILTAGYLWLLVRLPFWIAFVPCVIVGHRMGILLHEFMHGIPLRRYRDNLNVVTFVDGLLLLFGMLEVFRGTHLEHHRWLNTGRDPARESDSRTRARRRILPAFEPFQYLVYLADTFGGRKPYIRAGRILSSALISVAAIGFWVAVGRADVVWKLLAVTVFTTLVPVSLRGAVEHYNHPSAPGATNEYRVWIPLFNLNRHLHHHEDSTVPWYLLEYKTAEPLSHWHYFTHWFRVYVTHEFELMRPRTQRERSG
jgi:fatty acid desaturase